jgi:short-subunit dehydrogenase
MKVTIVTGAGSDIGASAKLLASRGHAVTLVGRRADALDEVAEPIAAAGGKALCVPADLVVPGSPAQNDVACQLDPAGARRALIHRPAPVRRDGAG